MKFINKGAFFNFKMVMNNGDVQAMKILDSSKPIDISKVNEDTSRFKVCFVVPGETLQRSIDFTFLNY